MGKRTGWSIVTLLTVTWILSGCANSSWWVLADLGVEKVQRAKLPKYVEARDSIPALADTRTRIFIYRPQTFFGTAAHPIAIVNGQWMGKKERPLEKNPLQPGSVFVIDSPTEVTEVLLYQVGRKEGTDPAIRLPASEDRTWYLRWGLGGIGYSILTVTEAKTALEEMEPLRFTGYFALGVEVASPATDSQDKELDRAIYLHETSRTKEAIKILKEIVDRDPGNMKATALLGDAYCGQGKYDKAVELLTRAVALDAEELKLRRSLGHAFMRMEKYDDAIEQYRYVLERSPDSWEAFADLGEALYEKGDLEEGLKVIAKAISIEPSNYNLRILCGLALSQAGKDSEALDQLLLAMMLNYEISQMYPILSDVTKGAISDFSKRVTDNPRDSVARQRLAYCLAYQKRVEEAKEEIERAIGIDPLNVASYYAKAVFLKFQDREHDAAAVLDAALSINPDDWACLKYRGELSNQFKDYSQGLEFLSKADKLNPGAFGTLVALGDSYANLAVLFLEKGDMDTDARYTTAAMEIYRRAYDQGSWHPVLNFQMGMLCLKMKLYDDAWKYARKAEHMEHPDAGRLIDALKSVSKEPW